MRLCGQNSGEHWSMVPKISPNLQHRAAAAKAAKSTLVHNTTTSAVTMRRCSGDAFYKAQRRRPFAKTGEPGSIIEEWNGDTSLE